MVAVLTVLTVVTFLTVIIVLIVLTTLEHSDGRRNYIIPQKGIKEARKQGSNSAASNLGQSRISLEMLTK
jgi:hypothetical protein